VLKKELAHTQTGTPFYASPEVWNDLPYDSKSDIWSFGCILYEMAALSPPFKANDLQGLYKKVKTGIFNPVPSCYSNDLCEFITSMLKLNPKERPSTDEILRNPILKKHLGSKFDEFSQSDSKRDPLLNTIKFNPYNLKSLKDNLPRSAYGDEDNL
jgi:NIMA (never in mitosis gene a)-related kinase